MIGKTIGHYHIVEELGLSGMSSIIKTYINLIPQSEAIAGGVVDD